MAKAKYRIIYNPYSGSNTGFSKAEKVKDFIKMMNSNLKI